MADTDSKIAKLREQSKLLHVKRKEVIDGGKVQGSTLTYRETLDSKVNELRTMNQKKQSFKNSMKECSDQLDALENEKRMLSKSMHPDY